MCNVPCTRVTNDEEVKSRIPTEEVLREGLGVPSSPGWETRGAESGQGRLNSGRPLDTQRG